MTVPPGSQIIILPAVYRFCSFLCKATMFLLTCGYEVGNSYSDPRGRPGNDCSIDQLFSLAVRIAASTSLPVRVTRIGKASMSSREVRKLTTQARSRNVPTTTALEMKTSPPLCKRCNNAVFSVLRYASTCSEPGVRSDGT